MIGRTLSHYEITAKLGEGGMGEVYRATDTKLGRDVALKALPAEMASSAERLERFRREAKALAALDHPSIVTVFSVEEADGVHFLTMQLVEGQSLDGLIPEGGLPAEQILEIGAWIAGALAAAHDKGIVHRDLKPANVMVTAEGRVKVLDFGLAQMSEVVERFSGSHLPTELLTREGVVMGTVPYMSPEQVSGLPVDHRTDIFSLGVILYEMAIGRRPFEGPSSAELASAILRDTPPPLGELRAGLPDRLAQVIGRCLEKNAADRWSSTLEVRDELRGAGAGEMSAGAAPLRAVPPAVAADSGAARAEEGFWVAVLPFKHTGANSDLAALAEGLSEEIVTGLSRFSYLRVIARSSTERYSGEAVDIRSVGKEIGARYVMEGSLRQAGTKLRLAVQLVDATTGAHLWAENYERAFSPEAVFELQDELVPRIVSTVADMNGVLPRSMGETVRGRNSDELSPYEAVVRSFSYFERVTAEELADSRAALELAVEKAPDYADSWAMLALLCAQEHGQGFDLLADSLASGAVAARRAVEAGPSNHLAHFSLAQVLFFQKEFPTFRNAAERAATLNPMDGNSIAFLGELLTYSGNFERGLTLAERAKQLNPHHPGWYWYTDFFYLYRQRNYPAALVAVQKANLPGHWGMHCALAAVYGQLGDRDAAGKAMRNLLDLRPDFADIARREFGKWWDLEFVEHMIDGLRRAGLGIPEEGEGADVSAGRPPTRPTSGEKRADEGSRSGEPPSVAALPFLTLGNDADVGVFAEGMTEDVIAQLAKVEGLKVIARGSVMAFKEREQGLREIGRRLGVSTLLDGSIRRAGDRVRIVVQLVEAASERPLWSETYDRNLQDIFAVQSDVALRVTSALSAELSPDLQKRIEKRPTDNMGAYRLYVEGRHCLLRATGEGIDKSLELFGKAVRLDPGYALPHAGMALAYVWIGLGYAPGLLESREANARAEDAARSALALDPDLGYAHSMLGYVRMVAHYDWEVAEREMRKALELSPGVPESLGALALLLSARGRHEEAIDVTRRALELDPLASVLSSDLATKYLRAGRYEEAIAEAHRLLALEPEFPMAHSTLGWAFLRTDRTEEGIRELARAVEAAPGNTMLLAQLGQANAEAGRTEDARAILDQLSAMAAEQYVSPYHLAYVHTGLGDHDRAVECLDRAYSEKASGLYGVAGSFLFEPLHDHPGFRSLLRRMHLVGSPRSAESSR